MKNLKQALNHEVVLKKTHRAMKFNQTSWLKPYIGFNTKLRKEAKNGFEGHFLMNQAIFLRTMSNVRKHRDINIVATVARRNYLVSGPNYCTTKLFFPILVSHGNQKT